MRTSWVPVLSLLGVVSAAREVLDALQLRAERHDGEAWLSVTDTSGGIHYANVAGRVTLPEGKRARNR